MALISLLPKVLTSTTILWRTMGIMPVRYYSTVPSSGAGSLPTLTLSSDQDHIDDEIFQVPKRLLPTHDVVVCNLHFRSYIPQILDFYVDFAQRAAYHLNMPCSGKVMLPTRTTRWTVNKASFVHAKTKENFERKTHKRLLQIKDANPDVVERWLWYLERNAPPGVGMRATKFEYEEIGAGQRMLEGVMKSTRRRRRREPPPSDTQEAVSGETIKAVAEKLVAELEQETAHINTKELKE